MYLLKIKNNCNMRLSDIFHNPPVFSTFKVIKILTLLPNDMFKHKLIINNLNITLMCISM